MRTVLYIVATLALVRLVATLALVRLVVALAWRSPPVSGASTLQIIMEKQ